jgi:hypothetical protein
MEHNFNPKKGDYKYILEDERRKENGEPTTPLLSIKEKKISRFLNWIKVHFLKRSKQKDQLKVSFPVLFECLIN